MTVLESRMPWKIFGPKTDVVTGGWGGGGDCIIMICMSCVRHQILFGDQIKKN